MIVIVYLGLTFFLLSSVCGVDRDIYNKSFFLPFFFLLELKVSRASCVHMEAQRAA